ncbi:major facilitator superfamily domain-containing protein [Hygrophoropsis aurantiaca]|uniref:Major facilitator superfamily domain-containing protein n=1 Tax=Hygrophoropsis aurantiaca TaxID=72124 RepID=A0ACB8AHV7_9AGAM|nr:major facilitator superfamily domain-containing protein [Hygrophoropsis aurantiaca]
MQTTTRRYTSLRNAEINPVNLKCSTLPIFALDNQYSRNFHLAWLGFFVAFLSWFAFSPLIPDAITTDLKLTPAQIGNSNIISLCSTLVVRIIAGPLVDRYGPRKVMAGLLVLGAIPSGLAGTISTVNGLYIIRFFIGILGGTFVTCQAWTTIFFDKNVVGQANALAGGWGNSGGGFTFLIMIALYNSLLTDGMSSHIAWRASFAIVPVPVLLSVAAAVLIFGTDHPAGRWSDRHKVAQKEFSSFAMDNSNIHDSTLYSEQNVIKNKRDDGAQDTITPVDNQSLVLSSPALSPLNLFCYAVSGLDVAVNQPLTWDIAYEIMVNPLTWLPSLAYMTTFGFELAMDATLANVLYTLLRTPSFGQTEAGYIAGIYGFLNLFTRPLGGYLGDKIYFKFGVPGKKFLMVGFGVIQGLLSLGLGLYLSNPQDRSLSVIITLFVILALFNQAANGVNFSLVPHCNPNSNGFMSGIVGAMGNLGGVLFAIIFRFEATAGTAFWVSGVVAIAVNAVLACVRVPSA